MLSAIQAVESINVEFHNPITVQQARTALDEMPGVTLVDTPSEGKYPMPADCAEQDDVFVGRIRRDRSVANGLSLWVVADNLRKGAATNAVQIAQLLTVMWSAVKA